MFDDANEFLTKHPECADQLIRAYLSREKPLLLREELVDLVEDFCNTDDGSALRGSTLYDVLCASQEAVVHEGTIHFAVRWSVARWSYVEFRTDRMTLSGIPAAAFLGAKERVLHDGSDPEPLLEPLLREEGEVRYIDKLVKSKI